MNLPGIHLLGRLVRRCLAPAARGMVGIRSVNQLRLAFGVSGARRPSCEKVAPLLA